MAVSYILIRPPQLPELGDPSDAFIVGYDPTTDKTVKIKVANIGGGSVSPPLDISWKSNIEYSSGEIVEYGLRLWKSLQGSNEGNFPTEGIWWTEVARGNQSITYWAAGVYTQDPTIKLVNDIFYRLDAALPFESVNFVNELANGDWVAIGGGGGGSSTFDDLTDTPNAKIAKKLVKVSDDGQGLEYTDYDSDEVVQKAEVYNVGTLKKFGSDGNDEDSGLTGESLDIYDITSQLILALENDSNWLDNNGNQILGSGLFSEGIKGQRYYSDDFYFECVNDFRWVRTFTGRPVIDIYNNPKLTLLEKSYLEDDTNWENGSYIGAQMEDIAQGTRYYDSGYVYEFVENNTPVRYLRS